MLDSLIILEGFMDVISLKKIGVNNAVALMGTNFSNFQLKIIKDLKKPLKLFLDGDAAGTKAMYKISALLIQNKIKFTIIDNVSKFDPDELINQGKSALVLKLIAESTNPYQYFLDKFLVNEKDLDFDQLSEISARMIALLKYETNYILVDKVIQLMHERLGIGLEAIKKELDVQPKAATFEEQSAIIPSQPHPPHQLVKKTAN
jgi:DNA primase